MTNYKPSTALRGLGFLLLLTSCSDPILKAPEPQVHFSDYTETPLVHKLVVKKLTYEGSSLPTGTEIGIFTWEGVLGGAGVWDADSGVTINVYGSSEDVVQFFSGDNFDPRIYNPRTGETHYADLIRKAGWDNWTENAISEVEIRGFETRETVVELVEGWNLISINVVPLRSMYTERDRTDKGPDIRRMFSQLTSSDPPNLHIVKDERGDFYVPFRNFNGISFWDFNSGYHVKVSRPVTCRWEGKPIPANQIINLNRGWKILPYLPTYPLTCDSINFYAISLIRTQVVVVKDESGHFADPARKFSNMLPWHEGQAFLIYMRTELSTIYPAPEADVPEIVPDTAGVTIGPWTMPHRRGNYESILIESFNGITPGPGDGVAAFSMSDVLSGVGPVAGGRCGMAVWGDDLTTEEIEGFRYGESYVLRYWSESENRIYELSSTLIQGDQMTYTTDGYSVVSATVR